MYVYMYVFLYCNRNIEALDEPHSRTPRGCDSRRERFGHPPPPAREAKARMEEKGCVGLGKVRVDRWLGLGVTFKDREWECVQVNV